METKIIAMAGVLVTVLAALIGGYVWVTRNDKRKPKNTSGGGTIGDNFTQKPQE